MNKLLLRFTLGLTLLLAIIGGTGYYLVNSTFATQWLIEKVIQMAPGDLKVGKITGKLTDRVRLFDITYQQDGTEVHIHKLSFRLQLLELMKNKIDLSYFKIDDAKIVLTNSSSASFTLDKKGNTKIAIPDLRLRLRNFHIKRLNIIDSKQNQVEFKNLRVNAKLSRRTLSMILITHIDGEKRLNLRMETSGKPSNYEIKLALDQAQTKWNLYALGNMDHVVFHTRENQMLGGTFKVLGDVSFGPKIKWLAEAHINKVRPGIFFKDWNGDISFDIKAGGQDQNLHMILTNLSGQIKNKKLSGDVQFDQVQHNQQINANLVMGDINLFAKGHLGLQNDLQWRVNIPQINDIFPSAKGKIVSSGHVTGTNREPMIQASLEVRKLDFQNWAADTLDINAHYQDKSHPINISMASTALTLANQSIGNVKAKFNGQLDHKDWHSQLTQLQIDAPNSLHFQLSAPTKIDYVQNTLKIDSLCLNNNQSKLCLTGEWHENNNYSAQLDAQHLPLSWFNPQLGDLQLQGTIKTSVKIAGSGQNCPNINANIQLEPGHFTYAVDQLPERFDYKGGNIVAKLTPQTFQSHIKLDLLQDSKLNADIHADAKEWHPDDYLASPIQGDFNLIVPKLAFLSGLIPKIDQTTGRAVAIGKISGTLKQPHVTANVKAYNAGFRLGMLNVRANNITIDGTVDNFHLEYHTDGKAGPGKFHLDGMTELKNNVIHTTLKLTGDNMLISNTPGVVVYATPQLNMDMKDKVMNLTGNIFVPRGAFRSYDYDDSIELSDDIVYLQKDATEKAAVSSVKLTSRIDIKLGDNITVDSKGLVGKLAGRLAINDVAGNATTAFGSLSVMDGHYIFRGQKLSIDNATLNFNGGPISNPNLNVRAIRKVGGAESPTSGFLDSKVARIVGIRITGTLKKYTLDLFAEPDLGISKSDILSYLLLGQSLDNLSKKKDNDKDNVTRNAQILLSAAQALNIGQGGGTVTKIISQIQSKFGLTELDVSSSETKDKTNPANTIQHTSLVLGRYLTPKLYINYSFDILDNNNTVRIRYFLNKNWSVQTESNTEGNGGVDLLYSFERG